MKVNSNCALKRSLALIDIEEWDEPLLWQLIIELTYRISPKILEECMEEVEEDYYCKHQRTIAQDYYE